MASTQMYMEFGGDPIEMGTMDVRELAPALLGLADVIEEANQLVTGGAANITLRVRSEFKKGSFGVDLDVAQTAVKDAIDFLSGKETSALNNILALIGINGGVIGLIQLLRKAMGRKHKHVVTVTKTKTVKVEFEGGDKCEVPQQVWDLFKNPKARKGMEGVVKPVQMDGMEYVIIRSGKNQEIRIEHDESEYFNATPERNNEKIDEKDCWLQVLSPSFIRGNKWKVSNGVDRFFVEIIDKEFLSEVGESKKTFGAKTMLFVTLKTKQWFEGNDLKLSREIIKVLKHTLNPQSEIQFKE